MSLFDSFEDFSQRFNQANSHWAIDVYSPPEQGYLQALNFACQLQTRGYQLGEISKAAREAFALSFGGEQDKDKVAVYFCPTGTAANAFGRFTTLDQNKSMIVYSPISHSVDREAGSVESLTGSRVLKPSDLFTAQELENFRKNGGDIPVASLREALEKREYYYLNQKPHLFSISVPSEDGSIPSLDYVRELAQFALENDMLLHMDGARLFVAAGALNKTLKEMTTDCGVDILTFGGSKVGMIGAEAVVFTPNFFKKYPYQHHYKDAATTFDQMRSNLKRIGALSGRSEEVSAQFLRALTDDYGLKVGRRAHEAACELARRLEGVPGIKQEKLVETNVVLFRISKKAKSILMQEYPYLKETPVPEENEVVIRFMASHATRETHLQQAVDSITKAVTECPI